MSEKLYPIRVRVTHKFTEAGLRGLWEYWCPNKPFSFRAACALARERLSDANVIDQQIHEGQQSLAEKQEQQENESQ